ncbi:MAG: AI-2E family transporter [Bacteroidales bacterium]
MEKKIPLIYTLTVTLLFVFLFISGIILARDFLAPVVLAILFSYLLLPVVNFLEKHNVHSILANLISILLLLVILTSIILIMYKNLEALLSDLPTLKAKANQNIDQMAGFIEANFGITIQSQKTYLKEGISNLFAAGGTFTKSIFSATTSTIFKLAVLPVFIFYLLFYRHHIHEFILKAIPESRRNTINDIVSKISYVTPRYIGGVFTVVLILSVLNSIGLYIIGLDHPIVFGIISAIFNFIPYFGTWIGAIIPFLFALLTGSTPHLALAVIFLFIIIQFIENNILTPNITGSYVNLNPLFTIFSIIVGGMIWGLIGMFVIVPVLAMIKITFEHFEPLKPYAFLIGNRVHSKSRWKIWLQKQFTFREKNKGNK